MNHVQYTLCLVTHGGTQDFFANKTEVVQCRNQELINIVNESLRTHDYTKIIDLMKENKDLVVYTNDPFISKVYADEDGIISYEYKKFNNFFPEQTDYQFAFIKDKQIKCLYSPKTKLELPPPNYLSFDEFSDKKNEINDKWYELIVDAIKNNSLNDRLINKFLKEKYFFKNSKKFVHIKKHKDETIKCLVTPYKEPSIMEKNTIAKEALAQLINKYKVFAEPFENFPFVSITCEAKEFSNLEKKLCRDLPVKIHKQNIVTLPKIIYSASTARKQSNLEAIKAYDAQKISKGKGVKIGIIDTGVDYTHEELKHLFGECKGYNFVNSEEPIDDNGHGSHVAGIIGGLTTGVAPECTLYSLKVLDKEGSGSSINILKAIDWSISNKLDVINLSLGSSFSSDIENTVIQTALNKGIRIVAAAGNDGENEYMYPASYDGVISVSAVNNDIERADFSNYNDKIFIAAPGVEIFSTYKNNSYQVLSGTSMASPHVAGVLALITSLKSLSLEESREVIKRTAQSLHNNLYFGNGLIRADNAVLQVKNG
ncbi:S8 family peptidase [archaeon]|nr:S8 family peptidase [archaeon]